MPIYIFIYINIIIIFLCLFPALLPLLLYTSLYTYNNIYRNTVQTNCDIINIKRFKSRPLYYSTESEAFWHNLLNKLMAVS